MIKKRGFAGDASTSVRVQIPLRLRKNWYQRSACDDLSGAGSILPRELAVRFFSSPPIAPKDSSSIFSVLSSALLMKLKTRGCAYLFKRISIEKVGPQWNYQRTKDILYVMRMLGHKSVQNTLVYTRMVGFKNEEYILAKASTIEDAQKLIEAEFEYVTEIDDMKLFRKRK
jgi:hypothetical protein